MTRHFMTMAALSAALLLGTAGVTASALDVGVSVGGGANAAASTSSGNTAASVNIGAGATANLGNLLDGIDLGGGTGGTGGSGGSGGGGFQAIVDSMSAGDREMLALRCRDVLIDPVIYKDDVVDFCRMIAKLDL